MGELEPRVRSSEMRKFRSMWWRNWMALQGDACVARGMGGDGGERKVGPRSSVPEPLGDWPGS